MRNAIGGMFLIGLGTITAPALAAPILYSTTGPDAASITTYVNQFRTDLGTLNANVAGSFGSGRREINWDGVPDARSAPNNLPANFFNVNSPRGAVFNTPGTGFQTSANAANPTSTPVEFGNIDPSYPSSFTTFSPQRLFTPLGSNIMDVNFFVPGSNVAAVTSAFAAVFTDVDAGGTTQIQYFDEWNNLLTTGFAQPLDGGLSFLGVRFDGGERIARVRITTGSVALGAGVVDVPGQQDVVAMDDFIYAEPTANIPEPATWALFGGGLLAVAIRRVLLSRR